MGFDPITLALANAYTNRQRLAYFEPGKVLLEHEIVSDKGMDLGLPLIDIVPGRKYTVTIFEGTKSFSSEYEAKEIHIEGENVHASYLGNLAPVGGEDTGEYFLVMSGEMGSEGDCTAVWRVGTASFETISVASPETIHPIDPKFIPGAVLPVVDMSDVLAFADGGGNINLTAEQCERIGFEATPKLVWFDFYGGLKTMVMLTPQTEHETEHETEVLCLGGVAVIEGGVHTLYLALSSEGGIAIVTAPSA